MQINIKKMKEAEKLFKEGKSEEALEYLDNYIDENEDNEKKRLEAELLKAQIFYRTGEFEKAKELSFKVKEKAINANLFSIVIDACITLSYLYLTLGQLENGINIINDGFDYLKKIKENSDVIINLKAQLNSRRGTLYIEKGDLDKALVYFNKSLSLYEEVNNETGRSGILYNMGLAYNIKGDHENGIKYLKKAIEVQKKQENYYGVAYSLMEIGGIYQREGKLEKALENFKAMAELFKEHGNKKNIAWSYTDLGNVYQAMGEISKALNYYEKGLPIYEELNDKRTLANHLRSMASAYRIKGEFLVSIDFNKQAIKLYEDIENQPYDARGYLNLAEDYHIIGDYKEAEIFYRKSLNIFKKEKNEILLGPNLFQIILMYLELGQKEQALSYYDELKNISFNRENRLFDQLKNLAEGLILRTKNRLIEKGKAQELFRKVSNEKITNHKYKVTALLALCENLLTEIKLFNNETILDEINQQIDKLFIIAEKQYSYSLKANAHLLNSKLRLLKFDIEGAKNELDNALRIAEKKGFQNLSIQISKQYDELLDKEHQWQKLIDDNISIAETIDYSGIEDLIESMIKIKEEETKLVHETPVYFSIISENGLSLYSKQFKEKISVDEQLVGGFLSAIKNFAQETFSSAGDIERIKFKDNTMILRVAEPIVICYVFKGESYLALQKTKQIVKEIQTDEYLWTRLNEAIKHSEIPENKLLESVITSNILKD